MKKSNILYIILTLIVIVGIVIVKNLGMNYSLEYSKSQAVEIYFNTEINKEEVQNISKEVFGEKVIVRDIDRFSDAVTVITKEISDEKKQELVNKLNEKYQIELKVEDITTLQLPKINGNDLIRKYISPLLIAIVLIMIYLSIRYRKIGHIKIAIVTIVKIAILTLAYESIIIITRQPIVNDYTISAGVIVAVIALIKLICGYENQLAELKEKEEVK